MNDYRGLDDPYQEDGSSPYCTILGHYKRSGYFDCYKAHLLSTLEEGSPEYKAAIKEVIDEMRAQVPEEDNLQKIQKRFVERNCLPDENSDYGIMFACGKRRHDSHNALMRWVITTIITNTIGCTE